MHALTFLHCGHNPRCDAIVNKKFDYFTLQLMTRGHIEVLYDDEKYSLRGAWLWSAFPAPHIRFYRAPGCAWWEHRYVAFQGALVSQWKAANLWPEAPQRLPNHRMVAWFDEMLENAKSESLWSARRATNLLERILIELAQARTQTPQGPHWLERVLENLNSEQHFAPDYSAIARDCGLGLSTLRRSFKNATGVTLHNYVMQKRIARAKELLGETDWPLKQIASHLHFSDVYFFSSQFRKSAGVSPSAYRKSRQA